jgi:hypothetical protein
MFEEHLPDMACVPYRRKMLYLVLTVPFVAILVLVAVYVWRFSPWLTVAMVFSYLWVCFFQAYCCACQECPYIGQFCPAIAGIIPGSWMAKWIYGNRVVVKSKTRFEIHATLGILGWLGWTFVPLWWIAKLNALLAVAYVAWQIVYYVIFGLTICPVCAVRETCPGGALQRVCLKREGSDENSRILL